MKNNYFGLSVFIIIFCLCFSGLNAEQESPPSVSEKTISMDFQDANLKDVLKVFSIQSGLNFIASESVHDRKITLYLDKVPVKEAMDKIFKANNLSYKLDEGANIFIVKDWGRPELETITRVYYIKYRSVPGANLENEKKGLLAKTPVSTTGGYSSSSQAAQPSGAYSQSAPVSQAIAGDMLTSIRQLLSANGKISQDISTNSLIITDVPNRFPEIERVIACLDVPQSQIMLDVEILDVSKNVVDKLGFRWGDAATDNGTPFTLLLPGGFARRGAAFFMGNVGKMAKQEISSSTAGSVALGSTYSQILDFLRTQTDTKYLARPRLLTLNNETAEITITKDEVVGKKETTVVPTTGGQTTTVEYIRSTDLVLTKEGTGVFMRVTPQINPDTNEITMVINPKSSITTTSTIASTQADAEVRSTKSIVKVKDGETVILGGLIHKDKNIVIKKLPILGDIPLFGALFRSKNQTKDIDRELIIFITPHIIKQANIELIHRDEAVLPGMTQDAVSGIGRQAAINDYLNKFDKRAK